MGSVQVQAKAFPVLTEEQTWGFDLRILDILIGACAGPFAKFAEELKESKELTREVMKRLHQKSLHDTVQAKEEQAETPNPKSLTTPLCLDSLWSTLNKATGLYGAIVCAEQLFHSSGHEAGKTTNCLI